MSPKKPPQRKPSSAPQRTQSSSAPIYGGGPTRAICRALRAEREAAGISQDELAARLKVTQGHISRWETSREPRLDVIVAIEAALGLPRGGLLQAAGYVAEVYTPTEKAAAADPRLTDGWRSIVIDMVKTAIRRSSEETGESPAAAPRTRRRA